MHIEFKDYTFDNTRAHHTNLNAMVWVFMPPKHTPSKHSKEMTKNSMKLKKKASKGRENIRQATNRKLCEKCDNLHIPKKYVQLNASEMLFVNISYF